MFATDTKLGAHCDADVAVLGDPGRFGSDAMTCLALHEARHHRIDPEPVTSP